MKIGDLFSFKIVPPQSTDSAAGQLPAADAARLALSPGQILKAKVLGMTADGKVQIELGGQMLEARSALPLAKGTDLWLEVRRGGPAPLLALAAKKGTAQEVVRLLVGEHGALGRLFTALGSVSLAAAGGSAPPETGLAQLVELFAGLAVGSEADAAKVAGQVALAGGESRLSLAAEAAALFRQLLSATHQPGGGADRGSASDLEKLARLLDLVQQCNSQPPAANEPAFFLCPCLLAGAAGWGEWLFSETGEERAGGGSETVQSLDFFLHLSRLGDLHLRVRLRGERLDGEFAVASESARSHLVSLLPELSGLLEGLGFGPVALGCRVASQTTLRTLKQTLEQTARLRPAGLIDLKA